VASERGKAQTTRESGVVGPAHESYQSGRELNGVEKPTTEGTSPVGENELTLVGILSTTGHANPVGSWGVHLPRLNTFDDR
jgi:hypothetical protein